MKKLLLATLVTSAIAPAVAKPYAQVDAGIYQFKSTGVDTAMKVESNASRFGYKAEVEVGPTTSAIGQAEFGMTLDDSATNIRNRNIFVGLKDSTFGTIKVGHQDSYVKLAQGKVDFFNDQAGEEADMKKVFDGEYRLKNAIMYESPSFKGVNVNVMLQQGEDAPVVRTGSGLTCAPITIDPTLTTPITVTPTCTANPSTTTVTDREGLADGVSASVTYNNEDMGLYLAVAMDTDVSKANDNVVSGLEDTTRLVASYTLPVGVVLNGMYQMTENKPSLTTTKERTGYLVGVGYKVTDTVFVKAQYQANDSTETSKLDVTNSQFGFGIDYAWSDKVKSGFIYTTRDEETSTSSAVTKKKHDIIGVSTQMKF